MAPGRSTDPSRSLATPLRRARFILAIVVATALVLSAPFIVSDNYGTRSSTVIAIDCEDRARMIERSFDPQGHATGDVDIEFALSAASAPLPGGESRLPRTDRRTA